MKKLNWGIIAPGNIARAFATALNGVPHANCYSVASRSANNAKAFANQYGFEKSYDDYQQMLKDPKLDVVYIASPHTLHAEHSIACLDAGKATLCEKPMAVNQREAESILEAAKRNNSFFMEAVWTRFNPIYKQVRQWIDSGGIGEINMVQATFGFYQSPSTESRLHNSALAGGATLDIGIYPITLSQMIFQQQPTAIKALGHIGQTEVDEQVGILLQYPNGKMAVHGATISAQTSHDAWIYGTHGKIRVHSMFWCPEKATLYGTDGEDTVDLPHKINGYEGEIDEVYRCLGSKLLASPTMSWDESLAVTKIMDEVRQQIGLVYPFE